MTCYNDQVKKKTMNNVLRAYAVAMVGTALVISAAALVFMEPVHVSHAASDFSTTSVAVGNAAPTISNVQINPSPIVLTENGTTSVAITATITDANGCAEVISSGTIWFALYRSGVATSTPSSTYNANSMYTTSSFGTFSVQASDTCTGGSDTTADVSSTVPVWYIADPTDASSTFSSEFWVGYVKAFDYTNSSSSATSSAQVELNTLTAITVTPLITFGTVAAGSNTAGVNQVATTTNTGNSKVDIEFSGTDMTGNGTIAATNQKYATATVTYASLAYTLSNSATVRDINLSDASVTSTPNTSTTYWGIAVPGGSASGTYTGTNTFTAVWSN
jgi:hypothetical protein